MNNWQIFFSFLSPLAAFGVAWFTVSRGNRQAELDRQDRRIEVREEADRKDKDRQRHAVKEFVRDFNKAYTQYSTNLYAPRRGNFDLNLIKSTDDDAFFEFLVEEFGIFSSTVMTLIEPLRVEIAEPLTRTAVDKVELVFGESVKNFESDIVDRFWEEKRTFPALLPQSVDVLIQVASRCLKYDVTTDDTTIAEATLKALDILMSDSNYATQDNHPTSANVTNYTKDENGLFTEGFQK